MARVVVDVMLKPEILDPQGKAVHGALPRLGFTGVSDVRQGKRFELEVDGEVTDDVLARVNELAGTLLSNPVIEDFAVHVEGAAASEDRRRHLSWSLDDVDARRAVAHRRERGGGPLAR